ncbi:MAG: phytanoyl-CoA dioxygenase family protein [Myxococcales bacterium]|nr:phytanoyl-CoA dioxygenase family protein [Myxococcales bacterium]
MSDVAHVFRRVQDPSFFRALAPTLTIGERTSFGAAGRTAGARPGALEPGGHVAWPAVVAAPRAAAMRAAIEALVAEGLPAVFAYVYDAFWEPLDALAGVAGPVLGPHEALADVWAWLVPREAGRRGWPAHRGLSTLERGEGGRPLTLNVWVALADVGPDEACMWIVPLDQDPDYPDHLDGRRGEGRAIPLPARAGDALAWNANALHWGGPMTERARGPRVSFSYTLRALGAPRVVDPLPEPLGFEARLDVVAAMIGTYAASEAAPPAVREWAEVTRALGAALRGRPA